LEGIIVGKLKRKPKTDQGKPAATRSSDSLKPKPDANKDAAKKKVQPRTAKRVKKVPVRIQEKESQDPENETALSPILKKLKPLADKYGWGKIKRKVKVLVAVVAIAIGAKFGLGLYCDHQDNKAKEQAAALVEQKKIKAAAAAKAKRQKRVDEVFNILKNCQDMSLLSQLCLDDQRKKVRENSADNYHVAKEFVKAGRIYAELGITKKISLMITACVDAKDKKGAQMIMDEINIISEAKAKAEEVVDKRIKARMVVIKKKRETRVKGIISRLRNCEDKSMLASMCVDLNEATLIMNAINMAKDTKDYERAGILYARFGNGSEAKKMIRMCTTQNNKLGVQRIMEELSVNAEAAKRFTDKVN
jgi:hypothetical protein